MNASKLLSGGGKMGLLTRQHNWSDSSIGNPETWPHSLLITLGILLNSRTAMLLFWGQDHICFYNDAYSPCFDEPFAFGKPGAQAFYDIWPVLEIIVQQVISGQETAVEEESPIPTYCDGKVNVMHRTASYSPVKDEEGHVAGVLVTGILQDLQAGKRALQEYADAKALDDIALKGSGIGVLYMDFVEGWINYDSEVARMVTGNANAAGITRDFLVSHIDERDSELQAVAMRQLRSGGELDIEPRFVRDDGSVRNLHVKGIGIKNDTGSVTGLSATVQDVTTQRTAFQKLEDSEAFLALFSDAVPAMIFYIDSQETYQHYNKTFMERIGVDRRQLKGKGVREIVGEEAYAFIKPHLMAAFAGERQAFEMKTSGRFGAGKWLSIVYTPHKTDNGFVEGIIVHATDISEHKTSVIALQESEARVRSLIEESPVATALFVGKNLIVNFANDVMLNSWRKDRHAIGLPLAQVVPELVGTRIFSQLDQAFITGESVEQKAGLANLLVNGMLKPFYFNYSFTPLRNDTGEVYAILNVAIDVTSEVLSRQHLEEAQTALRNAIEIADLGTWSVELDTGRMIFSEKQLEMFGMTDTENSYQSAFDIIHSEDRNRVLESFNEAITPGSSGIYDVEYRITNKKTLKEQIIHSQGEVTTGIDGKTKRIAGTARDITVERKMQNALEDEVQKRTEELAIAVEELRATNDELGLLNEQLSRSNDELSQYAYVASHDLQEPLRKIRYFASVLEAEDNISNESKSAVEKIARSSERMRQSIHDLLSFSRLLQPDAHMQLVDLNDIMNNVLGDLELQISERSANINVENLPTVMAVGLQMNQLFYNLLSNSLKFTEKGSLPQVNVFCRLLPETEISLYVKQAKPGCRYFEILFRDHGIGFEEQYAEQIFEVFKRLHTLYRYAGSGIGLAICRRIMANHHGTIFAESSPGNGSVFHIIMPENQSGTSFQFPG